MSVKCLFLTNLVPRKVEKENHLRKVRKSEERKVKNIEIVISISRNGLLKSCARFVIERSEIRKKQHDFKSVHFECRMVLFYMIWEKSRL